MTVVAAPLKMSLDDPEAAVRPELTTGPEAVRRHDDGQQVGDPERPHARRRLQHARDGLRSGFADQLAFRGLLQLEERVVVAYLAVEVDSNHRFGTSSVAFDPTVSVLKTGSLLVIQDSLVTSYRTEVHEALVHLGQEEVRPEDVSPLVAA